MMPASSLLACFLALASGAAAAQGAAVAPDRSTPEATVRSFVQAFGVRDIRACAACVLGADPDRAHVWLARHNPGLGMPQVKSVKATVNGDNAELAVTWELRGRSANNIEPNERVPITRKDGVWLIIPMSMARLDELRKARPKPEARVPLLAFVALVILRPELSGAPKPVELATPEAALRSFAEAFGANDLDGCVACVLGAKRSPVLDEVMKDYRAKPRLAIALLQTKIDGARAFVEVTLDRAKVTPPPAVAERETVVLKRTDDRWQIVPLNLHALLRLRSDAASGKETPAIALIAGTIACAEDLRQPLSAAEAEAQATACMSNLRQLCLAAILYAREHAGAFALTQQTMQDRLRPYCRSKDLFICPAVSAREAIYSLNANLSGLKARRIMRPPQTVLFYEGADGHLDFRHGGKVCVGFCDGRVERVDPRRAAALIWKP